MLKFGDTVHQRTEEVIEYTEEHPLNYDKSGVVIAIGFLNTKTVLPDGIHPDGYLNITFYH